MNTQKVERYINDPLLEVVDIFHTIQGEGPFSGTPAVFVRFAGCNLQCPMCDTDYTSKRKQLPPGGIINEIRTVSKDTKTRLVVLTGGEPFRQNLTRLIAELVAKDFYVQVETNGTLKCANFPWNYEFHQRKGAYIVCSPKTPTLHHSIMDNAAALKFVLSADSIDPIDGLPIHVLGLMHKKPILHHTFYKIPVFVQPADEQNTEKYNQNVKAALDSCMKFGYTFQVQVHKIVGVA